MEGGECSRAMRGDVAHNHGRLGLAGVWVASKGEVLELSQHVAVEGTARKQCCSSNDGRDEGDGDGDEERGHYEHGDWLTALCEEASLDNVDDIEDDLQHGGGKVRFHSSSNSVCVQCTSANRFKPRAVSSMC